MFCLSACACETCKCGIGVAAAILAAIAMGGVLCLAQNWVNRRNS